MKLGDTVTWEAVHFGVRQRLTTKIARYERPHVFEDRMVRGAFHSFSHVHRFYPTPDGTLMTDVFKYKSPLGLLGVVADKLFLERYMRQFLRERALYIKQVAEQEVHQ
jgi:ligand-binding SRPBCC domain-containing protein